MQATICLMGVDQVLALLILERDRLNRAIEALIASRPRRGRPRKDQFSSEEASSERKFTGRVFNAEQRAAQSAKMRAYWAKRRTAAGRRAPASSK